MQPPDLHSIVNRTILKYLVCSSDISRDHLMMLEYLENFGQGVFGDEILSQIIEDFPGELTDELLLVLSPPHLRHLKLTRCSRLSCNGLRQAIVKCQQLQALDFSECIHLLHPTVFCCLKDKAVNLVSLSLENSEVVSDDIVQVALMCCPQLKHLNLSSCSHITDAAFALSSCQVIGVSNTPSATSSMPSNTSSLPGHNLTSVDISGCQSLSTTAVKYLVSLCGTKLRSVNLAWTGVSCIALLYLAGLNMEEVAKLVCDTDHSPPVSAAVTTKYYRSSDNCTGQQSTLSSDGSHLLEQVPSVLHEQNRKGNDQTEQLQNQEEVACSGEDEHELQNQSDIISSISQKYLFSPNPVRGDCHDGNATLLNEFELLSLKDAILNTYKSTFFIGSEKHLQKFSETESDKESDDSFKTASEEFDVTTCFLPTSEKIHICSCKEALGPEERGRSHCQNSLDVKMKSARSRKCCGNVLAGGDSISDLLENSESSCEQSCVLVSSNEDTMPSSYLDNNEEWELRTRNAADLSGEQCQEGAVNEEVYEDCFEMVSHIINPCEEGMSKKDDIENCSNCIENSVCKTCLSDACMMAVKDVVITLSCEIAKEEELKSDYITNGANHTDLKCQSVHYDNTIDMESHFPIKSCMDHRAEEIMCDREECKRKKCASKQHTLKGVEFECSDALDVKSTDNGSIYDPICPNIPCSDHEPGQKSSVLHYVYNGDEKHCSDLEHTIKSCWKDAGFAFAACSEMEHSTCRSSEFVPMHSKVIQVSDLLQAQIYQPQITSLDITNIFYQNKPLGDVCLKVFSKACNHLKNFAVSWTGLDDDLLTYILRNEKELETLCLADCENLSNISVSTIPVHCPKLTSFDLKGMCYVTDHGVMPLTRSNELETLYLAEAAITDSSLKSIAKGCGAKLKVLDVSWCEDLTDSGMSIVANSCPSLQHLGLRQSAASHLTLNALAANCHFISSLNIAGVDDLTDVALGNMAESMPLLKEIDVSWNSSLSDAGVSALLECCAKLKKAVLCGLKRITSQPFLAIIGDLGRWFLLEELYRSNRRSLRNDSNRKLALKFCDADTAKSLGDQIPCRSMSYSPSLRQVLVEYSDKVNDDHLSAIVAVCRGTLFVKDYYGQPVEPKWIFR